VTEPRLILGDCLEVMAEMEPDSVDAIVTDPPYGLEFMGKEWDRLATVEPSADTLGWRAGHGGNGSASPTDGTPFGGAGSRVRYGKAGLAAQQWHYNWAVAALRVLKPAHYLVAFGGTRTHHRLMVALEDAGFEIRDTLMWLYGCLSEDTEVLVDGRWEPYHTATAGRHALCYDATDDSYTWQPIQEQVVYDYNDTAYRIESDGTDQLVSRNHRCLIHDGNGYTFCYAEEAARQHQVHVPVLEDVQGLLQAIPYVQPDTGITEQDLLARVPERDTSQEETARGARRFGVGGLRRLRQRGMEAAGMGEANDGSDVLTRLQWRIARGRVGTARAQGAGCLDAGGRGQLPGQDERGEQPRLEGWRHLLQDAWQLPRRALRSLSARVRSYGPQGRLCYGAPACGGAGAGTVAVAFRSGAPSGPQPREQRSDQSAPVRVEPRSQAVGASRFTRPDLARIAPVHYVGKVWCLRVPTGAFVARRNGKVFATGNSGFPKGKGNLKPAWEPIILCRKPGKGVRPLGIDECRIGIDPADDIHAKNPHTVGTIGATGIYGEGTPTLYEVPQGRWPANVILDETSGALLDEMSGVRTTGRLSPHHGNGALPRKDAGGFRQGTKVNREYGGDSGGASRFFYCPKASRSERNAGCEGLEAKVKDAEYRQPTGNPLVDRIHGCGKEAANHHPTVKPVALMSWLVRLISPPGGIVLDPFMGSGTTGVAAVQEGREFIGIEREPEYLEIAEARINNATRQGVLL